MRNLCVVFSGFWKIKQTWGIVEFGGLMKSLWCALEGADHAIFLLPVSRYLSDVFACVSEGVSLVLLVLAQSPCIRLLMWLPLLRRCTVEES